jgi:hypothetical protein
VSLSRTEKIAIVTLLVTLLALPPGWLALRSSGRSVPPAVTPSSSTYSSSGSNPDTTSTSSTNAIVTSTTGAQASETYLADLQPLGDPPRLETGGAEIGGKSYPRTLSFRCDDTELSPLEFNLARKGSQLLGILGLRDTESDQTIADVALYGDGRLLDKATIRIGQEHRLAMSVSGVLRLKFICSNRRVDSGNIPPEPVYVSLADARIEGVA